MSVTAEPDRTALLTPSPDEESGSAVYKNEVPPTPILFFDGHCNLCNFFVSMFLRLDAGSDPVRVKLASLQSPEVCSAAYSHDSCCPQAYGRLDRRATCSPDEGCGPRRSSRPDRPRTRRSSSSGPTASCTCAPPRHRRSVQESPTPWPGPAWPPAPLATRQQQTVTPPAGAEGGGASGAVLAVPALHAGALDPRLRLRGATSGHATRQPGGRRARRARGPARALSAPAWPHDARGRRASCLQACATPSTSWWRATASGSLARWTRADEPPRRTRSTSCRWSPPHAPAFVLQTS